MARQLLERYLSDVAQVTGRARDDTGGPRCRGEVPAQTRPACSPAFAGSSPTRTSSGATASGSSRTDGKRGSSMPRPGAPWSACLGHGRPPDRGGGRHRSGGAHHVLLQPPLHERAAGASWPTACSRWWLRRWRASGSSRAVQKPTRRPCSLARLYHVDRGEPEALAGDLPGAGLSRLRRWERWPLNGRPALQEPYTPYLGPPTCTSHPRRGESDPRQARPRSQELDRQLEEAGPRDHRRLLL